MIDREHDLPITKQAEVLKISRGSVYYLPRPVSPADLAIMRRLDRLHLEFPFAGSRMLRDLLAAEGCKIGRRHVKTLMRRMAIAEEKYRAWVESSSLRHIGQLRMCAAAMKRCRSIFLQPEVPALPRKSSFSWKRATEEGRLVLDRVKGGLLFELECFRGADQLLMQVSQSLQPKCEEARKI